MIRSMTAENKTNLNLLSPKNGQNILKQFVASYQRIVWECLTILWGWNKFEKVRKVITKNIDMSDPSSKLTVTNALEKI